MGNKIEAALWLTRLFTIFSSLFFLLPIFGWAVCFSASFDQLINKQKWNKFAMILDAVRGSVQNVAEVENLWPEIAGKETMKVLWCYFHCLLLTFQRKHARFVPEGPDSQRSHQCTQTAAESARLSTEQRVFLTADRGRQRTLPVLFTDIHGRISRHQYPLYFGQVVTFHLGPYLCLHVS